MQIVFGNRISPWLSMGLRNQDWGATGGVGSAQIGAEIILGSLTYPWIIDTAVCLTGNLFQIRLPFSRLFWNFPSTNLNTKGHCFNKYSSTERNILASKKGGVHVRTTIHPLKTLFLFQAVQILDFFDLSLQQTFLRNRSAWRRTCFFLNWAVKFSTSRRTRFVQCFLNVHRSVFR